MIRRAKNVTLRFSQGGADEIGHGSLEPAGPAFMDLSEAESTRERGENLRFGGKFVERIVGAIAARPGNIDRVMRRLPAEGGTGPARIHEELAARLAQLARLSDEGRR